MSGRSPTILINQIIGVNIMTPNEIAINIADLDPVNTTGDVNWSTMATYCFNPSTQGQIPDDQNQWD